MEFFQMQSDVISFKYNIIIYYYIIFNPILGLNFESVYILHFTFYIVFLGVFFVKC